MEVKVIPEKRAPSVSHRYITEYWEVNLPDKFSDDLKKKLEDKVDKRKDWPTELYETFIGRMRYSKIKDRSLDVGQLKFDEALLAIVDKWKKRVNFREESKQQTLDDAQEQNLGKVKPAKKNGPGKPLKPKKKR